MHEFWETLFSKLRLPINLIKLSLAYLKVSSPQRRGFVGSNDWQLGRSAGWFVTRLCPQGGKIGLVPGNPRYMCQQSLRC